MQFIQVFSAPAEAIFPASFFRDEDPIEDRKAAFLVGITSLGGVYFWDPEACQWECLK